MAPFVSDLLLLLFIFGGIGIAMYAFFLQPRRREFHTRMKFVSSMEVGARVQTFGGIIGTITHLDLEDGTARINIADGVEVTILAASIMGEFDRESIAESAQKGLNK